MHIAGLLYKDVSVRHSRYCIKMAKRIVKILSLPDILSHLFSMSRCLYEIPTGSSLTGARNTCLVKVSGYLYLLYA